MQGDGITQTFPVRELTKGHAKKPFPTAKLFHFVTAFVASDKGLELFVGN